MNRRVNASAPLFSRRYFSQSIVGRVDDTDELLRVHICSRNDSNAFLPMKFGAHQTVTIASQLLAYEVA